MNKFTKIIATALFALVLTACDKPSEKADYDKLIAWNKAQSEVQAQSQQKLQQALQEAVSEQNPNKAKMAIEEFNKSVQANIASLEALDLKSDQIKAAQKQTKEVLTLASELLTAQVNMETEASSAQTEEAKKALAEKIEKEQQAYVAKAKQLQEKVQALSELGAQLEAKFNPQPAPSAEQPAQTPTTK